MIPAVKMLDPVMGVDIHIILIPTPGGPVPTPIPHPFVGMVMDPMDLAPIVGATVMVNGMPRAQAGTGCKAIPPHIPMGGPFQKPPANEGEMFMGSATVEVDGDAFTYMGLPVLTCNDIGMPPPPRAKKKGGTKSMVLPTSVVMAIPAGPPVLVGGPPTISLMALGMKVAMAGLGKAFKKLKKMKKAKKALKSADEVPLKKCTKVGHPVDVATGKVFTEVVDFELPGPIPFKWERVWYSNSNYNGFLGHGWHSNHDITIKLTPSSERIIVRMADGRKIEFPNLEIGEEAFSRPERLDLIRDNDGYFLRDASRINYRFSSKKNTKGEFPLKYINNDAGFQIQYFYDDVGNLKEIIDSSGRLIKITTDSSKRITGVYVPHPEKENKIFPIVRYEYDEFSNMHRVYDALDNPFIYEYDYHLLVKETNRNSLNFYFEYDGNDYSAKCIHTWGDGGIYRCKLKYSDGLTLVENSLGYVKYYYHQNGLVTREIDHLGHITQFEFNQYFEKITEVDPLSRSTNYSYDQRGNLSLIQKPDGETLEMLYEDGLLISFKNELGKIWEWEYDQLGNTIGSKNPLGVEINYEYNDGLLAQIIDSFGNKTSIEYDNDFNACFLIEPNGNTVKWKMDKLGNRRVCIEGNGNIQRRNYDLLKRVVQVDEANGNRFFFEYDNEGNVTRARNKQNDVYFKYIGLNKLASREEAKSKVELIYNTEEDLIGIKNEHGFLYEFELNHNGEVELESDFDGIKRYYKRDAAGQVISILKASGIEAKFKYDLMGRIIGVDYSNGEFEKYSYSKDGELVEASNENRTIIYERDAIGNVLKEIQGPFEVSSTYDDFGLRTEVKSSLGANITFTRESTGNLSKIQTNYGEKSWEAIFHRDQLGREISRRFSNGIASKIKRDSFGRPVHYQINNRSQKSLKFRQYVWGINDRLEKLMDSKSGLIQFKHDIFGNLTSAQYGDGTSENRFPDEVGNLFRKNERTDRKYGPAGKLLKANETKYDYDLEGNLIRKINSNGQEWKYDWNAKGKLIRILRPDNKIISFTYDTLGRRLTKTYMGMVTNWVWDGDNPLHEWQEKIEDSPKKVNKRQELDAIIIRPRGFETNTTISDVVNPKTKSYVRIPDRSKLNFITWIFEPDINAPVAKIQSDKQFGICTDYLGTPVAMFDDNGREVWAAEISIYGDLRNLSGDKNACPFRWPGQYEDHETGLYYNRHRYYDTEMGQYISSDPFGLVGGLKPYAYVHDPLTWYDFFGLDCTKVIHAGKQGKHIPGHNNYIPGRSIVSEDAQKLLDDFHAGNIASSDVISPTKVRVDFGKPIGQHIDQATGVATETTKGIIHFGKGGAHIVPARP